MAGKKVGRPTSRNPQTEETLLNAIRLGCSRENAARIAGIAPSTLHRWMAEDPEFQEAIKSADASLEQGALAMINAAANADWKAAAWKLERKFPERWARRDPVSQQLLEQAREDGRAETLAQLEAEMADLTPAARKIVMDALGRLAAKAEARKELAR